MTTLVTGFPGFLGDALVDRLVATSSGTVDLTCLVQSRYRSLADRRAAAIEDERGAAGAIQLVSGDITAPDLGLGDGYDDLVASTVEVYHLAAVYDLGVDARSARRVNVDGTEHLLDLAETAHVERFHHVSTCYVSGRHPGRFGPDDLLVGQRFHNHYEVTKFQAEVAVRRAMAGGLPATVFRPAIVVGDSDTGATRKYDGPYRLVRFVLRQPRVAVVPLVGEPRRSELNVVPRDFVVDALVELASRPESVGETYQLADPAPPSVVDAVTAIAEAADRRAVTPRVPGWALLGALRHVPGLARVTGLDPEAVAYVDLPTRYDAEKTVTALEDTGIACPPFESYVARLVEFVREHPRVDGGPMV